MENAIYCPGITVPVGMDCGTHIEWYSNAPDWFVAETEAERRAA